MRATLNTLIRSVHAFYARFISPMLGMHCRFDPSCSCYARDALIIHGLRKGSWLAFKRLCRCTGLSAGGIDDLPPPSTNK